MSEAGSLAYYVPGLTVHQRAKVEAAGLAHVFDPAPFPWAPLPGLGPDGGEGLLVMVGDGKGLSRALATHEWRQAPGRPWWIGLCGDITPESLARREQIDGHWVRLDDGNRWLVPLARSFGAGSVLPQRLVLGPDGETWEGEPLERFARISAKAARVDQALRGELPDGEEPILVRKEGAAIAVEALSLNYRLGPVEASVLGLLTERTVFHVLCALVDVDGERLVAAAREEAAKKNDPADTPDGSSSADGVAV